MECPYCGKELVYHDWYGRKIPGEHYWILPTWQKEGDIFKCPNYDGFEDKEEAIKYAEENNIQFEEWEEICCDSAFFNGFFYEDRAGRVGEGYPC